MTIKVYNKGKLTVKITSQIMARDFLSLVINKTKQITLESGETAFKLKGEAIKVALLNGYNEGIEIFLQEEGFFVVED